MLIRDNDDATIGACYTMKDQLQDSFQYMANVREKREREREPVQKNYLKFYSGIIQ